MNVIYSTEMTLFVLIQRRRKKKPDEKEEITRVIITVVERLKKTEKNIE